MRAASDRLALVQPATLLRRSEPIRIGMPQLCRAGLSENWLWKAAGDEHWLALAEAHGMDCPDFRTIEGERLYPAFVRVMLADAELDRVAENDLLQFVLRLDRTGRTRFASEITVLAGQQRIAGLQMESVFLRRTIAGANTSAARAAVDRPCLLPLPGTSHAPIRADGLSRRHGFDPEGPIALRHTVDPNPHEDFNGADFLYFSSYQAMIDRAEWSWLRQADPLLTTRGREILYLGNIELGDRVDLALRGVRRASNAIAHWVEMRRVSDGRLIAVCASDRVARPGDMLR